MIFWDYLSQKQQIAYLSSNEGIIFMNILDKKVEEKLIKIIKKLKKKRPDLYKIVVKNVFRLESETYEVIETKKNEDGIYIAII